PPPWFHTLSLHDALPISAAERPAQSGDRVNVDFVGKRDGEEFDGGSANGYTLQLGSVNMIPGFDDGIVGMRAGDTKVLSLTFPEDRKSTRLNSSHVKISY